MFPAVIKKDLQTRQKQERAPFVSRPPPRQWIVMPVSRRDRTRKDLQIM